jgi:uncharacterized protein YukJ
VSLSYGFAKAKILDDPWLKPTRRRRETQYHLHVSLDVGGATWDTAINVGTDDSDDLLSYRLVYDFHHPLVAILSAAPPGATELTGQTQLPALDFLRSDVLAETGAWRLSDPMDGTEHPEPVASLLRLLQKAKQIQANVYVFGRFYSEGNGIHDTHMNQGSTKEFIHRPGDDGNDHNDIWQDGGVIVAISPDRWVAYFAAFEKQQIPTDDLGNPTAGSHPIGATPLAGLTDAGNKAKGRQARPRPG